jgi:outer membrane protein OmpA-like peptidoglycan-associated protein
VIALRIAIPLALLAAPAIVVSTWINSAEARLAQSTAAPKKSDVAVAAASDEGYCNADLKRVLRRVLLSCGLAGEDGRGCQPSQAKNVATMNGADFNALFNPMKHRGGIIQFDKGKSDLGENDKKLLEQIFADRKGASWFFVVSRASPEGAVEANRALSKVRAEAVMGHLNKTFQDQGLEKEVGLLYLGAEFAQLDQDYCSWRRSGDGECGSDEINRSAFIAWIDCQL